MTHTKHLNLKRYGYIQQNPVSSPATIILFVFYRLRGCQFVLDCK